MDKTAFDYARLLAEILRIQRWAGGDSIPADRIFGLMHGFESVLHEEQESFGITRETQDKVEDLLEEIEAGKQPVDGMAIKERLRRDKVDDTVARLVMRLCRLQSRFLEAIGKIDKEGSFANFHLDRLPEQDWFGALHYMELVDSTEGVHKKMHAVFAPAIPRVGEIVMPEGGSQMEVVAVEHLIVQQGYREGQPQRYLVPHIILKAIDDDSD